MTPDEIRGWAAEAGALDEFLQEPNLARLGTVEENGDPHLVPVWFHWDGQRFFVGSQAGDHKVANVRRTGRAAVEVDSDLRRRRGLLIQGSARVIDGPEVDRSTPASARRRSADTCPIVLPWRRRTA